MHDILLPSNRLTRLRNSYRLPAEAALAARMPLVGRRVPMRAYWRRRPVHLTELPREMIASGIARVTARVRGSAETLPRPHLRTLGRRGLRAASSASEVAVDAVRGAAAEARSKVERLPATAPSLTRPTHISAPSLPVGTAIGGHVARRWTIIVAVAAAAGALAAFYADPASGRRRRALLRDRFAHMRNVMTRTVPKRIEKRARFFRGVARGIGHGTAGLVLHDGHHVDVDDDTLVARVRSEALRTGTIKSGEINLEAYDGCVTLRGQLEHPGDIRRLVEATRRVEGVREVRSYLHLPGTLPPNKAEIYEREVAPQL